MKNGLTFQASLLGLLAAGILSTNVYALEDSSMQPPKSMQLAANSANTGQNFLIQNKTKPGVVSLSSGLQYKIVEEGTGPKPTARDTVTVDYSGHLVNGTEFDQGKSVTFPVSGVIPGWVQALQLMKVGSTWELYIPSDLAYGERGAPPSIGPNETLIFTVHLTSINK